VQLLVQLAQVPVLQVVGLLAILDLVTGVLDDLGILSVDLVLLHPVGGLQLPGVVFK
jgi:hypothetical protein